MKIWTLALGLFTVWQAAQAQPDSQSRLDRALEAKRVGQFDSSLVYFEQAMFAFKSEGDRRGLMNTLFPAADALYSLGKYDSSIVVLQETGKLAREISDSTMLSASIYQIGRNNWASGKINEAFLSYHESLELSESIRDSARIGRILNGLGTLYWRIKDYNSALSYYYKSHDYKQATSDRKGLVLVKNNIGMVQAEWGRPIEAVKLYNQALSLGAELEYPFGVAYSYYNLGGILLEQHEYDSAITLYLKGIEKYNEANALGGKRICLEKLAMAYDLKDDHPRAEASYQEMFELSTNPNHRALALSGLGQVALCTKRYSQAIDYVSRSLQTDEHDNELIIKNLDLLSQIYQQLGDYRKAFTAQSQARILNDSIFNTQKIGEFAMIETRYQMEKRDRENQILRRENEYQNSQIATTRLTLVASGIGILLLFGVLFLQIRTNREKNKHNKLLEYKNKEIRLQKDKIEAQNTQLNELNATKDKLFAIISHDLMSPLNYVNGMLDLATKGNLTQEEQNAALPEIHSKVNSMRQMMTSLLDWSRQQFEGKKPDATDISLRNILESELSLLLPAFAEKGVLTQLDIGDNYVVHVDQEHLKIITRNMLSNALKYSHPGDVVSLEAEWEDQYVVLSFKDSGVGIDPETIKHMLEHDGPRSSQPGTGQEKGSGLGFGLTHQFVKANGGKIDIESKENQGTTVKVYLRKPSFT